MSKKMSEKELNRKRLNLAAQFLFDCQMEAAYRHEGYGVNEFLARIALVKDYLQTLTKHPDYEVLSLLISDCEKAISESNNNEYLVDIFQAPIQYIDNNFKIL